MIGSFWLTLTTSVWAQDQPAPQVNSLVDTGGNYATGNYTLDDFTKQAIRAANLILGIVGSLALVMFIYGGFMFLISTGSADKIKQAKDIIIAAVIGLVIVFSSYMIIQFSLGAVGLRWGDNNLATINKPTPIKNSAGTSN